MIAPLERQEPPAKFESVKSISRSRSSGQVNAEADTREQRQSDPNKNKEKENAKPRSRSASVKKRKSSREKLKAGAADPTKSPESRVRRPVTRTKSEGTRTKKKGTRVSRTLSVGTKAKSDESPSTSPVRTRRSTKTATRVINLDAEEDVTSKPAAAVDNLPRRITRPRRNPSTSKLSVLRTQSASEKKSKRTSSPKITTTGGQLKKQHGSCPGLADLAKPKWLQPTAPPSSKPKKSKETKVSFSMTRDRKSEFIDYPVKFDIVERSSIYWYSKDDLKCLMDHELQIAFRNSSNMRRRFCCTRGIEHLLAGEDKASKVQNSVRGILKLQAQLKQSGEDEDAAKKLYTLSRKQSVGDRKKAIMFGFQDASDAREDDRPAPTNTERPSLARPSLVKSMSMRNSFRLLLLPTVSNHEK